MTSLASVSLCHSLGQSRKIAKPRTSGEIMVSFHPFTKCLNVTPASLITIR